MLLVRLFRALNTYFDEGWRVIAFQPILYFFLWGVSFRLWINQTAPPDFEKIIGLEFYGTWLTIGLCCPPLSLLAWFLTQKISGTWRLRGMWFRFAADVGIFVMILSYHIVTVMTYSPDETRLFSRYIVGGAMVFVLALIIRDVWALVINNIRARRIRRVRLK